MEVHSRRAYYPAPLPKCEPFRKYYLRPVMSAGRIVKHFLVITANSDYEDDDDHDGVIPTVVAPLDVEEATPNSK